MWESHGNRLWNGNQANAGVFNPTTETTSAPRNCAGDRHLHVLRRHQRIANIGFSKYNSMQVTARKRLTSQLDCIGVHLLEVDGSICRMRTERAHKSSQSD